MTSFEAKDTGLSSSFPRSAESMANLAAHPVAAMAAGSAVGLGMMSHAFGLWAGTMAGLAGAAETTLRASLRALEEADDRSFAAPPRQAATKTRTAVETLVEDARSTAREVVSATRHVAERTALDARKAGDVPAKTAFEASRRAAEVSVKMVKPAGMPRPERSDDLKAIAGIGPKLEQVLNGLGIWTYDQIAAWSEAEIAWIDDYLAFKGRIARDGWMEQASKLGRGR